MQYDWTGTDYRRRMFIRFGFAITSVTALLAIAVMAVV